MILLNPDSESIALLCIQLPKAGDESPLGPKEWHVLAERLAGAGLSPACLLDYPAGELAEKLGMPAREAERLARLLERRQQLAAELERLERLGIWLLTLADEGYPARWRERLGPGAPPVLFGTGEMALLEAGGLAIVGSRNVDEAGWEFAQEIARRCACCGLTVVSGGARGVDSAAMSAAVEAGGTAVGVLAHALESALRESAVRQAVTEGTMALVTPYHPRAPFSAGNAMARNKLIYALADYALVVASDMGKGGTWSGASEALRKRLVPLFVRDGPDVPVGNRGLLAQGGISFPDPFEGNLAEFLRRAAAARPELPQQLGLFA
ncbi:MAG: DNA-processing protein DprA [Anaerolineae bacterium]|nr:DNA-processing protein DprA [Anaerolineae bacterium]